MKYLFFLFALLSCQGTGISQPAIQLQPFATGFQRPVDIAHANDDRLFIAEQHTGRIWIVDRLGNKLPQPFLDLPPVGTQNEQGLLGLAFHTKYAENGYFYVNYTLPNGDTRISRFQRSDTDPNLADPNSEVVLIEVAQPFANHNGGCMKFGPDGYLYIGLGDGGSGGDPQNNGQKRNTLLGKILRIDVDGDTPYAIPADNPFFGNLTYAQEIWALGLRNPWRFSFDRLTGDLWIADVGQNAWEEIDFQPASSTGGENYGWRCYEGNHPFNTSGCGPASDYVGPVFEYANAAGDCSVTGGFVYRGLNFPQLFGHYLFADFCSGKIWSLTPDPNGGWTNQLLADLDNFQYSSFGENRNGELFLAALGSGIIYRVLETTEQWSYSLQLQQPTCPGFADGSAAVVFDSATPAMQVLWSDGDTAHQRFNLPVGDYSVTITAPNGATAVESFSLTSLIYLDAQVIAESCPGSLDGAIDLTLIGNVEPSTASWSDGANTFDRTGLAAGEYTVTITTDEGCTFSQTFAVETAHEAPLPPVIDVIGDTLLSVPDTFATYQWLLDGVAISGANGAQYTATQSGTYQVEVTNAAGCKAVSQPVQLTIGTSVELPPGLERLEVRPNPFSEGLHITMGAAAAMPISIALLDLDGRPTGHGATLLLVGEQSVYMPTADLPAGMYLLQFESEGYRWAWLVNHLGR